MSSRLKQAVMNRDEAAVEYALAEAVKQPAWSLADAIDQLLPLSLMEANPRYHLFLIQIDHNNLTF